MKIRWVGFNFTFKKKANLCFSFIMEYGRHSIKLGIKNYSVMKIMSNFFIACKLSSDTKTLYSGLGDMQVI